MISLYASINVFPQKGGGGGGDGDTWGLDCQISRYLQEFDRELCCMGGTLGVSAGNLEESMSNFGGTSKIVQHG